MLCYCKYADFFISGFNTLTGLSLPLLRVALPIGISFYTFQVLSYVVDVYRGQVEAQKSFIDLAAYIAMFPQLIAGPIVRYADIQEQLRHRSHSLEQAALGTRCFVIGLSKKVLIANVLYQLITVFKDSREPSILFYWLYAVACVLHIYFDFSGYSDMAVGLGRIFGFQFPQNFNYPFISASITEFWRRWHMTLGGWFRDYVYIPLGGNRDSRGRQLRNILIVWALTGLWHGAAWNFVLWGLFFAVLLMGEKLLYGKALGRTHVVKHLYTLLLVLVSFVLFDANSVHQAFTRIAAMFGGGQIPWTSVESLYYLRSYAVIFFIALVGATPLPAKLVARLSRSRGGQVLTGTLEPIVLTALLMVSTAFLVDGSFNPFLYFRF